MNIVMQPAISLDGFIALPNGDSYSWVNQEDEARYQKAVEKAGCACECCDFLQISEAASA